MASVHESKIVGLIGLVDNSNKLFTTPTRYLAGSLRLVWNGQVYEPTDTRHGWAEINDITVETTKAPRPNDVIQAFYQEKDAAGQLGLDDVVGTPFDPNGILP